MGRFLAGVASALLLAGAVFAWWKSSSTVKGTSPAVTLAGFVDTPHTPLSDPPAASEKTREQKRFDRYDKDRNGIISREEYLQSRRKAFARLDSNGDGRLSFEEWSAKAIAKFNGADADHSATLSPAEFATTRVVRKPRAINCPPAAQEQHGAGEADSDN